MLKQATGLDEDALAFALLPWLPPAPGPIFPTSTSVPSRAASAEQYFGGNMEFLGATMQQTVHAEQSAISHAAAL